MRLISVREKPKTDNLSILQFKRLQKGRILNDRHLLNMFVPATENCILNHQDILKKDFVGCPGNVGANKI